MSDTTEKKIITASDLTKPENRPSGLSEDLLGDMYRFVGAKDAVNNYVCFGYSNAAIDCVMRNADGTINYDNNYLYRIIGITSGGQFKLIKNTVIRESDTDDVYLWWDTKGSNKYWSESRIFLRLNGKGTNSVIGNKGDSNLLIDSTTSNVTYIKSSKEKGDTTWYDKIESHIWKYGDVTNPDRTAKSIYNIENGFERTIEAKIGLMYISDLYYSYAASGTDSSSTNCYTPSGGVCKDGWLTLENNGESVRSYGEWSMTRYGYNGEGYQVWIVNYAGSMNKYLLNDSNLIRPVFFLTPEASQIEDGKGTASEPFIIVK